MNRIILPLTLALSLGLAGCQQDQAEGDSKQAAAIDTPEQKISYVIGVQIASQFERQGMEIDIPAFSQALDDVLNGEGARMSDEDMQAAMRSFQEEARDKRLAEMEQAGKDNKAASEAFLEENAQREGVVVTDTGLQYEVIEPGTGATPAEGNAVTVHYRGTTIEGEEFDSSYQRGEPTTFGVNQVIPGWSEALQLMKEGAKWKLYIPSELAYGSAGAGGLIGPNQALIFEVELLDADAPKAGIPGMRAGSQQGAPEEASAEDAEQAPAE